MRLGRGIGGGRSKRGVGRGRGGHAGEEGELFEHFHTRKIENKQSAGLGGGEERSQFNFNPAICTRCATDSD